MFEVRRAQSEKPKVFHELIEGNFKEGSGFIEWFARPHNLRTGWIQIGNELDEDANRGYLSERRRLLKE